MHKRPFRIFTLPPMRRHERATLGYSYSGEFGRGLFTGLVTDFVMAVAVVVFGITSDNNKLLLWLLSSASSFGMLTAMTVTIVSSRWRKRTVVVALEVASRAFVILAAFAAGRTAFVTVMAMAVLLNSINVPLISGIYGANFGKLIRGRAVGRLHGIAMLTSAVVAFYAGEIVNANPLRYPTVFLAVGTLSLLCSLATRRIPETPTRNSGRPVISLGGILQIMRKDHTFMFLEVCWFIFGFSNLWLMPLKVLRLNDIGFDIAQIAIATTAVMTGVQIVGLGIWGRIIYRMNFAYYRILVAAFFIVGFALFFYPTSYPLVLIGSFTWGLALAGGTLSWRLVATFFTDPRQVPAYMAIHTLLCGVRGFFGPILAFTIREHFSTGTAAALSIAGMVVSSLMLLALAPKMERRRKHIDKTTR